jgi:hypothetical protein
MPCLASSRAAEELTGGSRWLIDLADSGEVTPLPELTPAPLTKPWFTGIANIRGVLYSVVDFAAWRGGAPTPINAQSRLLLIGARQGINSALLVRRALGLRPQLEMRATGEVRTGIGETAPWLGRTFQGCAGCRLDPVAHSCPAGGPTLSRYCALSAPERKDHGLQAALQTAKL